MADFADLLSDKALVCHREVHSGAGGANLFSVLLSDGFLIECGSGGMGERRAGVLAALINEGEAHRLSKAALR